jgi:hypothetical protein
MIDISFWNIQEYRTKEKRIPIILSRNTVKYMLTNITGINQTIVLLLLSSKFVSILSSVNEIG